MTSDVPPVGTSLPEIVRPASVGRRTVLGAAWAAPVIAAAVGAPSAAASGTDPAEAFLAWESSTSTMGRTYTLIFTVPEGSAAEGHSVDIEFADYTTFYSRGLRIIQASDFGSLSPRWLVSVNEEDRTTHVTAASAKAGVHLFTVVVTYETNFALPPACDLVASWTVDGVSSAQDATITLIPPADLQLVWVEDPAVFRQSRALNDLIVTVPDDYPYVDSAALLSHLPGTTFPHTVRLQATDRAFGWNVTEDRREYTTGPRRLLPGIYTFDYDFTRSFTEANEPFPLRFTIPSKDVSIDVPLRFVV